MAYPCPVCGKPVVEKEGVCDACGSAEGVHACPDGHLSCTRCLDSDVMRRIVEYCDTCDSRDPYAVFDSLVALDGMRMHDFKHHVAVGASLIAAYCNITGDGRKRQFLEKMSERGRKVPPGSCGLMGNCGAAVSVGTFLSIITGTTPYSEEGWAEANRATAECLLRMADIGGPRCCKRNSYIAIETGSVLAGRHGCRMPAHPSIVCGRSADNAECIKGRCPYYKD